MPVESFLTVFNTNEWIEQNKSNFVPPVCNKCMFSDQLKVFFVGGPNERKDYHIEEGEEFFYMEKGDMCLKVVEGGCFKDIIIKQGEVFMLPGRIYHSPQRFQDTIGLVIERTRSSQEFDALTYFVEDSDEILFERWMHLKDIVTDLPPIIRSFFASEAYKTGRPTEDSVLSEGERPFSPKFKTTLEKPFSLNQWMEENRKELQEMGKKMLFGSPYYESKVEVLSQGTHQIPGNGAETFIRQLRGCSVVKMKDSEGESIDERELSEGFVALAKQSVEVLVGDGGYCLTLRMPTPATN